MQGDRELFEKKKAELRSEIERQLQQAYTTQLAALYLLDDQDNIVSVSADQDYGMFGFYPIGTMRMLASGTTPR